MTKQLASLLLLSSISTTAFADCQSSEVSVQVLGSGGPELGDGRASASYLIWHKERATILIDAGGGSSLNFEKAGARVADLQLVLFTHLHVDHSADWPVYVKASFFEDRDRDLPVLGPKGNNLLASTVDFHQATLQHAWPYLSSYIDPEARSEYKLKPVNVTTGRSIWQQQYDNLSISAIDVNHGPLPAIAWRIDIGDCSITFSGDTSAVSDNLTRLTNRSDLLIAHNAIPQQASGVARRLHMPPSRIGEIAAAAGVGQLVLSHRMLRTLETKEDTLEQIRQRYSGPVSFANDLDRYQP